MTKMPMHSAPGQSTARGVRSWPAAAVAACAAASALITACSSVAGGAGASKALTPATAIRLTADETQSVTSLGGTISIEASSVNVNGTFQFQLKPALVIEESLNASGSGESTAIDEILSGTALYLKVPGLSSQTGKPWVEINLRGLSGTLGAALNQLIQNAETSNPLTQTQELTASKNAHEVGTQVIDGVSTTHYAGTLTPSAALAKLSPSLRQDLSSAMGELQGNIAWNIWTDSQHNLRKLTESYTVAGSPLNLTMTISSINQSVSVTVPPAGQVTVLPASALSGSNL
jgi:hypothetical protein